MSRNHFENEGLCLVVAENYSTFKMAISYFDGLTLGYYGCSDDAQALADGKNYQIF